MKTVFITGTDTGVGKTVVAGLLARHLLGRGYTVVTQKWVQTGVKNSSGDISVHLRLMGKKRNEYRNFLSYMSPYLFGFPFSPHLAASVERKTIDIVKIKESLTRLQKHFDFVIVEGIGGVSVPLDKRHLVIDIVKELGLQVLLVAGNRLGAINHTLLSIEALKRRDIKILGIVFNNILKLENKAVLKDNPRIVEELSGIKVLGTLPWARDISRLYDSFIPIGSNTYRTIKGRTGSLAKERSVPNSGGRGQFPDGQGTRS